MKKNGKFLYADLADRIQDQIDKGSFKLSDKLPSLRTLCQETGYSMTTVFQAYVELEKRGQVESRHRSGYYIKPRAGFGGARPKIRHHEVVRQKISLDDLIHQLTLDMGDPGILKLGGVAVAPEHLPFKNLHKVIRSIPQGQIPDVIAGYAHPQGDRALRNQISNLFVSLYSLGIGRGHGGHRRMHRSPEPEPESRGRSRRHGDGGIPGRSLAEADHQRFQYVRP